MFGLLARAVKSGVILRSLDQPLLSRETLSSLSSVSGAQTIPLVHELLLALRRDKHRLGLQLV